MKPPAPRSKNEKMPGRFLNGSVSNMVLAAILMEKSELRDELATATGEKLFGFYLPDFQRPPVWNEGQNIRFMESLWLELPIGSYVINACGFLGDKLHPYDYMLLDGQQRLRAIEGYIKNEFPVFGYHFNEISIVDNRRFKNLSFPRYELHETNIENLKRIYNRMNFGGTAHTESQKATL